PDTRRHRQYARPAHPDGRRAIRSRRGGRKASLHEREIAWIACMREPRRHRKIMFAQEIGIEQLGAIARAVIAEHGHDHMPGPEIARKSDSASDVDAARTPKAKPFLHHEI